MESRRKAREKRKKTISFPGIDSKIKYKKLLQYFSTISGSEKIRDRNVPKLDSSSTSFKPMKAKVEREKKNISRIEKTPRCLFTVKSCFSKPRRIIILFKRPLGGLARTVDAKFSSSLIGIQ